MITDPPMHIIMVYFEGCDTCRNDIKMLYTQISSFPGAYPMCAH